MQIQGFTTKSSWVLITWNAAAGGELDSPDRSILCHPEQTELSYVKRERIFSVSPASKPIQLSQGNVTTQDITFGKGCFCRKTWEICAFPGLFLCGSADLLTMTVLTSGSSSVMGDGAETLILLMRQHQPGGSGLPFWTHAKFPACSLKWSWLVFLHGQNQSPTASPAFWQGS